MIDFTFSSLDAEYGLSAKDFDGKIFGCSVVTILRLFEGSSQDFCSMRADYDKEQKASSCDSV